MENSNIYSKIYYLLLVPGATPPFQNSHVLIQPPLFIFEGSRDGREDRVVLLILNLLGRFLCLLAVLVDPTVVGLVDVALVQKDEEDDVVPETSEPATSKAAN